MQCSLSHKKELLATDTVAWGTKGTEPERGRQEYTQGRQGQARGRKSILRSERKSTQRAEKGKGTTWNDMQGKGRERTRRKEGNMRKHVYENDKDRERQRNEGESK